MNLFELFAKLGLDTSEFNDHIDEALDHASTFTEVLKANLASLGFEKAIEGAKKLAEALSGLVTDALDAYASFEQLEGGIRTLFGNSADTIIENADKAFETAGLSANEYLEITMSFGASLLQSIVNQETSLTEEEIEIRKKALDKQYTDQQNALNREYTAKKNAYDKQYTALQNALNKEYEARQRQLERQYDAVSDSWDEQIEAVRKAANKAQEEAEKAYEADVEAYEKATEERLKLIDNEYKERLKLIDEEKYNRLKAIDDQIDQLNALTDAERKQIELQEQQEKRQELSEKIRKATNLKDRQKALKDLYDYEAKIAQKEREEERKDQIEALKDQKDTIKEEADQQKEAEKEKKDAAVDAVKEESKATLKAMKEAYNEQKAAAKEAQDDQLAQMRKAKADELKELKYAQSDELSALKEGQAEQLRAVKEAQAEDLTSLKEHNKERLQEIKDQVKAEKKALEESSSGSLEATEEQMAKAAELTNTAIINMSDIANKMGIPMERIMDAYRGFSRGNFTMLDNLALGFGGTKSEMERLLDTVKNFEDQAQITGDLSVDSFMSIIEAIDATLDAMHISGTTMDEAETTIEGSRSRMYAAWRNLLLGFGRDDADIGTLIDNVIDSVETYLHNAMPRIEKILEGFGELITRIAPIVEEKLPELLDMIVPPIINLLHMIASAIAPSLPGIIASLFSAVTDSINEYAPGLLSIIEAVLIFKLITSISSVVTAVGQIGTAFGGLAGQIAGMSGTFSGFGGILDGLSLSTAGWALAWTALITEVVVGVKTWSEAYTTFEDASKAHKNEMDTVLSSYERLYTEKGKEVADQWAKMVYNIDTSGMELEEAQKALAEEVEKNWEDVPENMWEGFKQGWDYYMNGEGGGVIGLAHDAFFGMIDGVKSLLGISSPSTVFDNIGENTIQGFLDGVRAAWNSVQNFFSTSFGNLIQNAANWGVDFINGIVGSINSGINSVATAASNVATAIRNFLHFTRPDVGPLRDYETWMPDFVQGLALGIRRNEHVVKDAVADMTKSMGDAIPNLQEQLANADFSAVASIGEVNGTGTAFSRQQASNTRIEMLLEEMMDKVTHLGVYLYGDVMVGELREGMNEALGELSSTYRREVVV